MLPLGILFNSVYVHHFPIAIVSKLIQSPIFLTEDGGAYPIYFGKTCVR